MLGGSTGGLVEDEKEVETRVSEVVESSSIMSGGCIGEDEKGVSDFFEGDRSTGGNRWPRQETLALLKIRFDMDAVFRDSSLKGPLWEEVSRKMGELGYQRSSKKCKEKFENVYKYHKRTKDGRVGKSDGKTYRFFDELEKLEQRNSSQSLPLPPLPPVTPRAQPQPQPPTHAVPVSIVMPAGNNSVPAGVTVTSNPHPFSITTATQNVQQQHYHQHHSSPIQMENGSSPSDTPSSSSSTSSDEELMGRRKKKRKWKDFFETLMKDVIDKQEQSQKRFLETIEKREHDRLVREEAWKAQEMGRLNREHDVLVQERSMAAAKDAALLDLLKKLSDRHQIPLPFPVQLQPQLQPQPLPQTQTQARATAAVVTATVVTTTPQVSQQMIPQQQVSKIHVQETPVALAVPVAVPAQPQPLTQIAPQVAQQQSFVFGSPSNTNVDIHESNNGSETPLQPSSSRWPKAEVEALINLRTKLDEKYHENSPKGPLWEEISTAMKQEGYNRNAKKCKEKWENINKYFKKVKESNKKRPEDSKTCPYFHQLDALYRKKSIRMDNVGLTTTMQSKPENLNTMGPIMAQPEQQWPAQDDDSEDDDGDDDEDDDQGNGYEIVANNNNNVGNAGINSISTATTNVTTTN